MAYNPQILDDLLRSRAISRSALSERIGIERADLERELRRDPEPKQSILNTIAKELALPPFVFYMQTAPKLQQVIPDFRSTTPAPSPKSRETLAIVDYAAGIQELAIKLGASPARGLMWLDPSETQGIDKAAHSARTYFNITLQDQLDAKDVKAFYVLCRKRIEDAGIFVLQETFPEKDGSGFCLAHSTHPVIVINTKRQNSARRLFTLIHELAHVLTRKTGISDPFVRRNAIEVYCNSFASTFLVPANYVGPLLGAKKVVREPEPSDVQWVARKFKISQQASILRLEQLGLVKAGSHDKWLALMKDANPDWKNKGGGAGGPPPQEKVKLAKYGFRFAEQFGSMLANHQIDPLRLYRATGLKPKYQQPYIQFTSAIGVEELRKLELEDE